MDLVKILRKKLDDISRKIKEDIKKETKEDKST